MEAIRTKDLHIPENIRLTFQPAYSPEVNPVEHLWEEVCEKYFRNRIFSSLEDLARVLCQALHELTEDQERLLSMMFFPQFRQANCTQFVCSCQSSKGDVVKRAMTTVLL